ncbi:MAG: 50S ribosomal protein L4 [Oscillospiraceae bacterium]|nr:50S ribosomal protein L4 [Oscillospiraceae bacterium]
MPKATVYNMAAVPTGEIELSDAVFGIEPNTSVMHEAVKNHLANCRQGTQSALTRAEVSGGGIKPLRQKGTGRARQGSTRGPHYTHGGVAFAPKPRDYGYRMNKKQRRLAIRSALSAKAAEGKIIVIDDLNMSEIKTKTFAGLISKLDAGKKSLVVLPEVRENVIKSADNIPGVTTTLSTIISAYDILNHDSFIVDKAALQTIEEVFA